MESGNLSTSADKLDVMMSILKQLHYDAIGIGQFDLRAGGEFTKVADAKKLTVLDASAQPKPSTIPYIVKTVNGVKVGIISFGAHDNTGADDFTERRSLYGAYKAARDKSDVLVVLDQSGTVDKEWIERNSTRFGAPDVVVGGITKMGLLEPEVVGRTYIVPTGYQGKQVGIVDIEVVPGEAPKLTCRKVLLGTDVAEDENVKRQVKAFTAEQERNVAVAPAVVTPQPTYTPQVVASHPQNNSKPVAKPYYPPTLCKTCHVQEYDNWAKTGHAKALKTLADAEQMTPECLSCHSEMYRTVKQTSALSKEPAGVDCQSCHQDALPHGLERSNTAVRTSVDRKLCQNCHTKDRSPDYNEKTYFPKMMHVKG
ncbi:MAG: multiheme c-type cytochrome [Armatimonadota bacterium]|nr:hypothetical protein [bacterium]